MKKLGFLGRQLLIYSLIMIVVVIVLICCANTYVMNISREQAATTQTLLANAALEQVDAYLDQVLLIATQTARDSEIVEIMKALHTKNNDPEENYFASHPQDLEHVVQILEQHNSLPNSISLLTVQNNYGDYACTNPTEKRLEYRAKYHNSYIYSKTFGLEKREFIMMGPTPSGVIPSFLDQNSIYMIVPIKSYDGEEIYGYLQVYRPLKPLFIQLDAQQQNGIHIYLFYEISRQRGKQFYPVDQPFPDTSTGNYLETELRSNYWWYVVLVQDQAEFLASYRPMLLYLLLGGAGVLLLLLLCGYLIIRYTSKPIMELNSQVKQANLENFPKVPVSDRALDEVKELELSVDRMLKRIKASVELEQQAYLRALQAQLRPHFLYNCLSTISSLGVESGSPVIPEFCSHLAAILRYESSYDKSHVTLAEEVTNVQDYLELMKVRYEDDIAYTLDIDPSLKSLPMPRMILQPMAENSFEHGFRSVEPPWLLSIRAFREDAHWVIQVSDNGAGFDDTVRVQLMEQAEQLCQNLSEGYADLQIGGLGLVSTIVRLRLLCGNNVSFSIAPNGSTGTMITLRGDLYD